MPPTVRNEEKRFVELAVVEKKLVVVAWVVVLLSAKNPPVKVDEAVERKPFKNPRVVEVELPQEVGVKGKALAAVRQFTPLPVIAPVPFPVRHPVRVEAPVPP